LRAVKSPLAPKMTMEHGPGARRSLARSMHGGSWDWCVTSMGQRMAEAGEEHKQESASEKLLARPRDFSENNCARA